MKPSPEKWRLFVWEQATVLLTTANQMEPTTETVRAYFFGVFACIQPEYGNAIEEFVKAIADPGWQWSGWVDLGTLYDATVPKD